MTTPYAKLVRNVNTWVQSEMAPENRPKMVPCSLIFRASLHSGSYLQLLGRADIPDNDDLDSNGILFEPVEGGYLVLPWDDVYVQILTEEQYEKRVSQMQDQAEERAAMGALLRAQKAGLVG